MSDYTECMKPYMKGGGEDRRLRFCIGAKLCSGKAAKEDEAKRICLAEPPKEPKPRTSKRGNNCHVTMAELATCAIAKIDWDAITQATFEKHLTEVLQECSCGKAKRIKKVRPSLPKGIPKQMLTAPTSAQHWSKV